MEINQSEKNSINPSSDTISLVLEKNKGEVHQDYDELNIWAKFTFSNQDPLGSSAKLEAKLTSGRFYKYLSPPVEISRKNSTYWELHFSSDLRRGFGADNYTIDLHGYYDNHHISQQFTLTILSNPDIIAPELSVEPLDHPEINNFYDFTNDESYSFKIHAKDNREINYLGLWNFEQEIYIHPRGSAGEAPYNDTGTIFTNRTDILVYNLTVSKTSFINVQPPEGEYLFSFFAEDRTGNRIFLNHNFTIKVDIWSGSLAIDSSGIQDPSSISMSWNYNNELNKKSPLEFLIELDTDADRELDYILETTYSSTSYEFEMPDGWVIPDLTVVEELEGYKVYLFSVTVCDIYDNCNQATTGIKIDISDYISELHASDNDDSSVKEKAEPNSSMGLLEIIVWSSVLFIVGPLLLKPLRKYKDLLKGTN